MAGSPIALRRASLALASATLLSCAAAGPAAGDDGVRVVASIKPVHSLASAVMAGVGEPHLIVRGASSPHTFTMRPSDAAALEAADAIFMIDDTMAAALAGPVETLGGNARVVRLAELPGLVRRPLRKGGAFEAHDHDGHGHAGYDDRHDHDRHDHDDHAKHDDHDDRDHDRHDHDDHDDRDDHDDDHDHDDHRHHDGHHDHDYHGGHDRDDHDDDDHDGHDDGPYDLHVWLDPINARTMVRAIADTLADIDPANAAVYEANADALARLLEDLVEEIAARVAPARGVPFVVFHDAYRHFEDRFGLTAVGSVVVAPERPPGARRISELRDKVQALGVACVFDEPQFDKRLVRAIAEGGDVRIGTVDPLGAAIADGPELYVTLMRNMAAAFRDCLAPDGSA